MKVEQLTVFVENRSGRGAIITRLLADAGINLISFNIADSSDYGLIRIIADDPEKAKGILKEHNISVKSTSIIVVELPHEIGGLADVLEIFSKENINIDYLYAFVGNKPNRAIVGVKVADTDESIEKLKEHNLKLLSLNDII